MILTLLIGAGAGLGAVSRYLLDQLRPAAAPERVQLATYRGGHMFYFSDDQRRAFTADAKLFYQGAK